jgi:hypothetical protein
MRRSYRLKLWWLGLGSTGHVFVFAFVLFMFLVLLGII